MKTGRNEPCPCGSGKKYKKCCYSKNIGNVTHLFLEQPVRDYGPPRLTKDFLDKNPIEEISAAKMLYSILLAPEIEILSSTFARKFITRGKKEEEKIKRERDPENLLKIMEQCPDPINHPLLKKRILNFSSITVPKIIEKLKSNQDDTFVELAIKIIYESKIDCSSILLEILDSIKDPYTLSLVCLLLGFVGPRESIQLVWNYYHFFKDEYPGEHYEQGPLLALLRLKDRFSLN